MTSLIFMGTPAFAVPTLKALHEAGHDVVAVYTQPPRPAGRGQQEQKSPVQLYAEAHGLPVYTPASLKNTEAQATFAAHGAEVAVVAAYGLLLPPAILAACPHGCVNVHPSLLPRWRGAAPIQRTLMAGDTQTGVCIMQMDAGLDTGAVLAMERFTIPAEMDAGGLHDALAEIGARLMLEVLEKKPAAVPQASDGVTYAHKLTKADGRIDWQHNAHAIANQIRALSPMPGAFFMHANEAIKVFAATASPTPHHAAPGTILDGQLTVACGQGALTLHTLQRPGKKRMQAADLLKGFSLPAGTVLG